jgi:hypothetical protein
MRCAWCERTDPDCIPLFLAPEAEAIGRYLPEISQQETWCKRCRDQVAILIERVREHVRLEIGLPRVCCSCHRVISGSVSHGYCHECATREIGRLSPPGSVVVAVIAVLAALLLLAGCKPLAAVLPQHPLKPEPGRIYEIAWPVKVNVFLPNREIRQMLASPETTWVVGKPSPEPKKEIRHEALPVVPAPGPVPFVAAAPSE